MPAELKVAHCPSCGKVYQINLRNLCGDCQRTLDAQLNAMDRYMMRNRQASTEQLSEATGVPLKTIRDLIRQKKYSISGYPNLADACDLCGGPARSGRLCDRCASRLKADIHDMLKREQADKQRLLAASAYKFKPS